MGVITPASANGAPPIENVFVVRRRRKLHSVNHLEKLCPEVQVENIGDLLDVLV
jgi:hypothetical protein